MRLTPPVRASRLLAACLAAAAVAGCVEGTGVGPELAREGVLLLAPVLTLPGSASAADAPISQARLTARDAATGAVYGTTTVELDPGADEWTLPLSLELPEDDQVRVVVTIELLALVDGALVVQWSGLTAPLAVLPGDQANEVHQVPLFRGPPDNRGVLSVELGSAPASVLEGDRFQLSAAVNGGGENATVYFSTLDAGVASVDGAGNVVTLRRGTARIVAAAGTRADTAVVEVRAWLPSAAAVAVIAPGLDDAASRIAPNLTSDAPSGTALRALLGTIREALRAGLGLSAKQALDQGRQVIAGYGAGGAAARADGPDLGVVGLVLDHVERVLNAAR